jgi:hypothetical protein
MGQLGESGEYLMERVECGIDYKFGAPRWYWYIWDLWGPTNLVARAGWV